MKIKSVLGFIYRRYVRKKWNMTSAGASLLTNGFYQDYKNRSRWGYSLLDVWNVHKNGFCISDWIIMDLDNEKCKQYISNAQYYAKHPFNGQYSKWIDDKLTLKYLCTGTRLDRYMPQYYFMTDVHGNVKRLMDCPESIESDNADGIVELLIEKKVLAIKRISGSIGEGFYKAEYKDGKLYLNGREKSKEGLKADLLKLSNYLMIEYLCPHSQLAEYCQATCNCIRYLVGRIDGNLKMIKSYIRFGAVQSGFVENYNVGGVLCYVGLAEKGHIYSN